MRTVKCTALPWIAVTAKYHFEISKHNTNVVSTLELHAPWAQKQNFIALAYRIIFGIIWVINLCF